MQNHYNLLYREEEREMSPLCVDMGVGMLPWSPLARGLLTRPRADATSTVRGGSDPFTGEWYAESNHEIVDAVGAIADERGVPMAQVALAWVMSRPGVTAPIVGATKPHHLTDAVAAVDLELSLDEIARLEGPYRPRPIAGY